MNGKQFYFIELSYRPQLTHAEHVQYFPVSEQDLEFRKMQEQMIEEHDRHEREWRWRLNNLLFIEQQKGTFD